MRYIAVDIEAAGANVLENPIMAVGMSWVDLSPDGTLKCAGSRVWALPVDGIKYEQRCWDEFWQHQAEVHHKLQLLWKEQGMAPGEVWRQFREVLDATCQEAVAKPGGKVCLVSDNPGYDIGRLNIEMSRYGLPTLDYLRKDPSDPAALKYSSVRFTGTVKRLNKLKKLVGGGYTVAKIPYEHNHMPDSDAMTIAWEYASADAALGIEA